MTLTFELKIYVLQASHSHTYDSFCSRELNELYQLSKWISAFALVWGDFPTFSECYKQCRSWTEVWSTVIKYQQNIRRTLLRMLTCIARAECINVSFSLDMVVCITKCTSPAIHKQHQLHLDFIYTKYNNHSDILKNRCIYIYIFMCKKIE